MDTPEEMSVDERVAFEAWAGVEYEAKAPLKAKALSEWDMCKLAFRAAWHAATERAAKICEGRADCIRNFKGPKDPELVKRYIWASEDCASEIREE